MGSGASSSSQYRRRQSAPAARYTAGRRSAPYPPRASIGDASFYPSSSDVLPPYPLPNVAYTQVFPAIQQFPSPPPSTFPGFHWSESRDMTLSRILSAEEFLATYDGVFQRIEEHDAMIQELSQREDRDQYLSGITVMLGLRGHMYGELLRIQMMLAADDPLMKNIAEFEVSHARVVDKLRELEDCSDRFRDASTSSGDPLGGIACETQTSVTGGGISTASGGDGSSVWINGNAAAAATQSDTVACVDVATQPRTSINCGTDADDDDDVDVGTMTEQELKEKHDKEETAVAERFARLIASNQLSMDEVNRLLSEHAHSVHLLRLRQGDERQRLQDRLDAKLRARRSTQPGTDDDDDEDGGSSDNHMTEKRQNDDDDAPEASATYSSNSTMDLNEAVHQLEMMRLRGELTADAVAKMMGQYLPNTSSTSATATPSASNNRHNQYGEDIHESVSMLVQDNLKNQRQIQTRRQHEKEQVEERLKQKLREKNYQLRQQNFD